MFDDILDDGRLEAAAAAAVPAPASPRIAAARPRINGRQGLRHPAAAIQNLVAGTVRARVKHLENVIQVTNQSTLFSKHVARVCFANSNPNDSKILAVSGDNIYVSNARRGSRSNDFGLCCDYGIVSAISAQAEGIANLVGHEKTTSLIGVSTFDDASMWVKDPAPARDRQEGRRTEGSKINGQLWKRGSTIHLPVTNCTETLIARRSSSGGCDGSSSLRACEVHSGSTVLPKGNTATIRNAWKSWTAASVSGSGFRIDPDNVVSDAISKSEAWASYSVTKDNLMLNQLIMGLEEKCISDQLDSGLQDENTVDTFLHINCCGHSAVLCTKPALDRLDGLPGHCVRLGHLHESGRVSGLHRSYLDDIVDAKFRFRPVTADTLPPEFHEWKRETKNIMSASRCGRDLTEADEASILSIDN